MLVWDRGHSFQSGRSLRYGESGLILLPDRTKRFRYKPTWQHIGTQGGRFSEERIRSVAHILDDVFPCSTSMLIQIARDRQTLLIGGGGNRPQPSRHIGEDAYRAWYKEPNRGFITP